MGRATKNLKHIEIVFENCEVVRIPARDIVHFNMSGVTKSYYLLNGHNSGYKNEMEETNECRNVQFILSRRANQMKNWVSDFPDKKMPFDRIMAWPDITHIELFYSDGRSISIATPWEDGESDEVNDIQESKVFEDQLYVYIGKDYVEKKSLEKPVEISPEAKALIERAKAKNE